MQSYVKILIVDMMLKKKNKFSFVIHYLNKLLCDFYRDFYILFPTSRSECYSSQTLVNHHSETENPRGPHRNSGASLTFVLFYKLFPETESLCLTDYQVHAGFGLKYHLQHAIQSLKTLCTPSKTLCQTFWRLSQNLPPFFELLTLV